jgi:hypothetical protein
LTQSRNAVSGVGMTVVVLLLISETPSRMNRAPRPRSTRPISRAAQTATSA